MSYIVPGKFPTSCSGCHLFMLDDRDLWCIANHYAGYCRELSEYIDEDKFVNERRPNCPLIEVPTPHGRLIDADKFAETLKEVSIRQGYDKLFSDNILSVGDVFDAIVADLKGEGLDKYKLAPTVIEAED